MATRIPSSSSLQSHNLPFFLRPSSASPLSLLSGFLQSTAQNAPKKGHFGFTCQSSSDGDEDYLLDAPVSVGDGFSFSGGKYSDGPNPADEWFRRGKIVKAHPVVGSGNKAKDPFFGLTMGGGSQASNDVFRSIYYAEIEDGISAGFVRIETSSVYMIFAIDGFALKVEALKILQLYYFTVCLHRRISCKLLSCAYSYRKVLPILSKDYHAISFDWLGFGFSDKPQPGYGFDYTLPEYVSSLESLVDELATNKVSLVAQGYFAPVAVKYASSHQEKINNLILLNPPLTAKHANLPSTLSIFSNFLLGEIFSQDPLRASDKALTSCGPYKMKEDDAMVYRRPYLTSGSSGFALNAISRAMKKELKAYVEEMRIILTDKDWKIPTTICWGQRDRWLSYDGVEDFCEVSKHRLIELPKAGHHVQEDCGEELGQIIAGIISKKSWI
ncbi:hypothetical protein RHGRI_036075 [Rhododendron griersonianum]|uniref:AB hydrolase-1 domain-containing protein n=1 Tax=Rhododendron griersonianum TaxID=479676 RepID=A0AAV6HMF5_9ERIC|nr:hypothetical protein RHGRI_036075 [Rhododendron griersonianum]